MKVDLEQLFCAGEVEQRERAGVTAGTKGLTGGPELPVAGRDAWASGCSGPSAWERVGRSARSAGEENGAAGVGRTGERKRGNGPAGFGLFCWVGLIWFFSFPSPSLIPISNQLNLFEFKFEFEFKPHSNK